MDIGIRKNFGKWQVSVMVKLIDNDTCCGIGNITSMEVWADSDESNNTMWMGSMPKRLPIKIRDEILRDLWKRVQYECGKNGGYSIIAITDVGTSNRNLKSYSDANRIDVFSGQLNLHNMAKLNNFIPGASGKNKNSGNRVYIFSKRVDNVRRKNPPKDTWTEGSVGW